MKTTRYIICMTIILAACSALTSNSQAQDFGDFGLPGLQDLVPQLQGNSGFLNPGVVTPRFEQPHHGHSPYVNPGFIQQLCNNPPRIVHPIVQPAPVARPAEPANIREARNKTDVAKAFFKTHQYSDAERRLNEVVKLVADDTNAWQFRSLVLFAQGKYDAAAADAYDAIKLGNTWTAQVLDTIYPTADRYHGQLNQLIETSKTNPSMSVHFLLGYHYLVLNDLENGRDQLQKVLALQPGEPVTTQLLAAINAKQQSAGEMQSATAGSR